VTVIGSNLGDNINGSSNVTLTPKNYNVALIGDSLTAQCSNTSGTENQGYLTWALRFSGQTLRFKHENNFGVGGYTSAHAKTRVPDVIASGCGVCIVFIGANDRGSANMTYTQTATNLTEIRDALIGGGVVPVFVTPPPGGDSVNPLTRTAQQLSFTYDIRRFIMTELGNENCHVVDLWPTMAEPTSTIGEIKDGYTHDGLHWIAEGAIVGGRAIGAVLATIGRSALNLPTSNSEAWSADYTKGAINPNPTMQGTSGTVGTGGSGDLATSWESGNTSAVPNVTRTFSKVTNARGDWQQVVLGGTSTQVGGTDIGLQRGFAGTLVAGKSYEVVGEVEWDDDFVNVSSVQLTLQLSAGGTITAWDGDKYTGASLIPAAEETSMLLRCSPITVPAGVTDARVRLSVYTGLDDSDTLVGTIRYRNIVLREVDA